MINITDANLLDSEYAGLVKKASEGNEDAFLENSTVDHAKVIYYYLIKKSKKIIRVFTGSLSELFCESFLIRECTEKAVKDGREIQIITTDETIPEFYASLLKDKQIVIKSIAAKKGDNHFMLSDQSAFRVELPHDLGDCNDMRGKANFNNSRVGEFICKHFDGMWDNGKLLTLN